MNHVKVLRFQECLRLLAAVRHGEIYSFASGGLRQVPIFAVQGLTVRRWRKRVGIEGKTARHLGISQWNRGRKNQRVKRLRVLRSTLACHRGHGRNTDRLVVLPT